MVAVTLPSLDVEKSLPKRRGIHLLGEKTACVSAAVSDESVAGDSGVYEAFVKQQGPSPSGCCTHVGDRLGGPCPPSTRCSGKRCGH